MTKENIIYYLKLVIHKIYPKAFELSDKEKVKVLQEALNLYERRESQCLCRCIYKALLNLKYIKRKEIKDTYNGRYIKFYIPKFNSKYLTGKKISYDVVWWNLLDRASRKRALLRLINEYDK